MMTLEGALLNTRYVEVVYINEDHDVETGVTVYKVLAHMRSTGHEYTLHECDSKESAKDFINDLFLRIRW